MAESLEYGVQEEILISPSFAAAATALYADASDLVYRIRFGEASAIEELAQLFSKALRFFFFRIFGNHDLDGRVSDTLVAVVRTIQSGEFRDPAHLMDLIRTIAHQQVEVRLEDVSGDRNLALVDGDENSTGAISSQKKLESCAP